MSVKKFFRYGMAIIVVASLLLASGCQPTAQVTSEPTAAETGAEATTVSEPTAAETGGEATQAEPTAAETGGETTAATCEDLWQEGMPFCEAPMLAEKVAAGELPPVEDRVPSEPEVGNFRISWAEMERGQYGGTMRLVDYDAGTIGHDGSWAMNEPWIETAGLTHDGSALSGGIFKDLEILEGDTVFVFYMRKGMKFSNGADFTSEDIAFWWNDVMLNTTLTPSISSNFRSGHKPDGNIPTFEVVDDYTFKFTFDSPYGGWPGLMTYGGGLATFTDSDYLKQFHVDYADPTELAAKVEEQGYEEGEWYRLWSYYQDVTKQNLTGYPTYGPWVLTDMTDTMATLERNPYYFKVDDWGQQLPYVDQVTVRIVSDVNTAAVEIAAGNVDMARRPVSPANLTIYSQNAEAGGYNVYIQDQHASLGEVFLNLTYDDPVWQEYVGNVEFRKALSMAIDREAIIDAVYYGIAEIPQTIVQPDYDPEGAIAILESLGLTEMDDNGCRLGSDGKPFTIPFEMGTFTGEEIPVGEMVAADWTKIGICSTVKNIDTALFQTMAAANETRAFTWWAHYPRWPWHENGDYIGIAWQKTYAPLWYAWYEYNMGGGKEANPDETDPLVLGVEPPESYLTLREKQNEMFATSDPDQQKALWEEMKQIISDNEFIISIVDPVKGPLICSKSLGNCSENGYAIENAAAAEWFFFRQ